MRLELSRIAAFVCALLTAVPILAFAQTDEIQVYDGGLAPVGTFNLTLHNNFTPKGLTTPAFPGAVVADKSLNGVPEWALGVTPWFEAGLYLPLYSRDKHSGFGLDGFKLRALFAVPQRRRPQILLRRQLRVQHQRAPLGHERASPLRSGRSSAGISSRWTSSSTRSSTPPTTACKNLEFVPATRVAYNFRSGWTAAAEEYDDFGSVHAFAPRGEQAHQLFAVVDRTWREWDVEAGDRRRPDERDRIGSR